MPATPAIEIVVFRAKPGVLPQALTEAALSAQACIETIDGYVGRNFGSNSEEQYVDIVYWKSLQHAQAAAQTVMTLAPCQHFFSLIDASSIQMLHFEQQR